MATVMRQPFTPLDGTRLQSLTSIKNRQNAVPSSPMKRKVSPDDVENVDPVSNTKRSKGDGFNFFKDGNFNFEAYKPLPPSMLTKSLPAPAPPSARNLDLPDSRTYLKPKSPSARLQKAAAPPAPAGRSPTRGAKRIGILSRRRSVRVSPPRFTLGSAPFSLDAAIKGTIASFADRKTDAIDPTNASWSFVIHEDTKEQEMTNLLQHSTCTLDISSDEETEYKAKRDRAEGRDKENVPPADDVSQTSVRTRDDTDTKRGPLREMAVEEYYGEGLDSSSVVVVLDDVDEDVTELPSDTDNVFAPQQLLTPPEHLDMIITNGKDEATHSVLLEPIEGTGESFELWESASAKDESVPGSPLVAEPETSEG